MMEDLWHGILNVSTFRSRKQRLIKMIMYLHLRQSDLNYFSISVLYLKNKVIGVELRRIRLFLI